MKPISTTFLAIAVLFSVTNNAAQARSLTGIAENGKAISSGFEENKGQVRTTAGDAAPFVRYRLTQGNTNIFLLENGIAYQFNRTHYPLGYAELKAAAVLEESEEKELEGMRNTIRTETFRMDMRLEGADPHPHVTTEGRIAGYVNDYHHGALNVHSYEQVIYHNVYPGIDWVVYTTTDGIKYDFIVQPGADPSAIVLHFQDHEELFVDERGALVHGNPLGRFTEEPPVSFQGGKTIATRFALDGDRLRFVIGDHDRSQPLTIDPARAWGTYYGGVDDDEGYGCATDGNGNIYLAGITRSTGAIAEGGLQNTLGGDQDAFLAKFDADGLRLWATYYGGDSLDQARGCAVDASGNVYLAGTTESPSGIASGGHQSTFEGGFYGDAFLVKFNPDGTRIWATYYGGTMSDQGYSCAVDANDNVYLAGNTKSPTGIADGGFQNTIGNQSNAFLVKFAPEGTRLWGTYYGDAGDDYGRGCATAPDGSVLLVGDTRSNENIATPGAHQTTNATFGDAFLVKFDANGARSWATYYGGSSNDFGFAVATDAGGNIFLAGSTFSSSAIAANGFQNTRGGAVDAFLVKFSTAGTRIWGTYYGGGGPTGNSSQQAYSCATDEDGNVYIGGKTASPNGIASNGYQNTFADWGDGFLVKFNGSGARLWGTYYGGEGEDRVNGCAVDLDGNVVIAGTTISATAIASSDGHSSTIGGGTDAFLAKLYGSDGTAIEEVLQQDLLRLLPNPNRGDRWYLDLSAIPGAQGAIPMEVLDQNGRRVASNTLQVTGGSATAVPLDVDLPSGVYFLRVWVDGSAYTVRSVVQR